MCEGKVGVHPGLVEERKPPFQGERKIQMRDIQLTGVEGPEGVGGGVVDVEVT